MAKLGVHLFTERTLLSCSHRVTKKPGCVSSFMRIYTIYIELRYTNAVNRYHYTVSNFGIVIKKMLFEASALNV